MVIEGKTFFAEAAAALGIIQRDNIIFHMLTFISLIKRIFMVLPGYAMTV